MRTNFQSPLIAAEKILAFIFRRNMENPKVSEQDLIDLIVCGSTWLVTWKHVFYALKTKILETYGMPYGYSLQVWEDENYDERWYDEKTGETIHEWFATHHHILKRYYLSTQDGKFTSHEFHIPTNEFAYWNDYGVSKKSEHYNEFFDKCTDRFEGKKRHNWSESDREAGWKALKRLMQKYGFLLDERKFRKSIFSALKSYTRYTMREASDEHIYEIVDSMMALYR
jgi:hypothetical protein